MVHPISPRNVTSAKKALLPDAVLEAFNFLIAKEWNGYEAVIKQKDAVKLILEKLQKSGDADATEDYIFENNFLDIEDIYRQIGWKVEYDKPAYNETYPAKFIFSKRR